MNTQTTIIMKTYIYTTWTSKEAKRSNLLFYSSGKLNANELVEVQLKGSESIRYYTEDKFNHIFKLNQ